MVYILSRLLIGNYLSGYLFFKTIRPRIKNLRVYFLSNFFRFYVESLNGIEKAHYLLVIVTHCLEKDGDVEFFLSVYPHMEHILQIIFKIKPAAILGNDSRYK